MNEQKETVDGLVDAECGAEVQAGNAGLCRLVIGIMLHKTCMVLDLVIKKKILTAQGKTDMSLKAFNYCVLKDLTCSLEWKKEDRTCSEHFC